MTGSIWK